MNPLWFLCGCCRLHEASGIFRQKKEEERRLLNFHDCKQPRKLKDIPSCFNIIWHSSHEYSLISHMNTPKPIWIQLNYKKIARQKWQSADDVRRRCSVHLSTKWKKILRVGISELRESFSRSQPSDELRSRINKFIASFPGAFLSPAARN